VPVARAAALQQAFVPRVEAVELPPRAAVAELASLVAGQGLPVVRRLGLPASPQQPDAPMRSAQPVSSLPVALQAAPVLAAALRVVELLVLPTC
jgi:hypothetical protein